MNNANRLERERRAPLVIDSSLVIPDAEVLEGSVTLQGERLRPWLFEKLQDPDNAGVILAGESGAGKTTDMSQVIKGLMYLTKGRIFINAITSGVELDDRARELTRMRRQGFDHRGNPVTPLGPNEEYNRSHFGDDEWVWSGERLTGNLIHAISDVLRPSSHRLDSPKRLVGDIAGLGTKILTGRLALLGLPEVIKRYGKNLVILVFPGNPDIQDKSLVDRVESDKVLTEISQRRGSERILSVEEVLKRQPLTSQEEAQLNDLILRRNISSDTDLLSTIAAIREGTRPDRFDRVRTTLWEQEILRWARSERAFESYVGPTSRKLATLQNQGIYQMADSMKKGIYDLKLAYGVKFMHEDLGVPEDSDQARVVLAPFIGGPIHQYQRLLHSKIA